MSSLQNNFISSSSYNSLPNIYDVADVPTIHRKDLDDLRQVLQKHNVPPTVCIRLLHKHFDAVDGEVMVLRVISVPSEGNVQIMGPMIPRESERSLRGLNFMIDDDGQFHPYEYTTSPAPDMSNYELFLEEFSRMIIERGLQRKLGLKLGIEEGVTGWTEFEIPEKRATLMIPQGVKLPDAEYELSVSTDFYAATGPITRCYHCSHCYHCDHGGYWKGVEEYSSGKDKTLFFAGQRLENGSPVHNIVGTAIMAM